MMNGTDSKFEGSAAKAQKELSVRAWASFRSGNFNDSVAILRQLSENKQRDAKVLHNLAVAEYYQNNLKTFDTFKAQLQAAANAAGIDFKSIETLNNPNYCVIYYNQAVLHYHTKQYANALAIINKVFTMIESIGDELACRVALLSIDLYIVTKQPEKALTLIDYISERCSVMVNKQGEQSAREEKFRWKLAEYKLRCHLQLRMLHQCDQEIANLCSRCEEIVDRVGYETEDVYKLRCKTKACGVKILNACYEYLKQKFSKSVLSLSSVPTMNHYKETGESIPVILYNDLGCVYFTAKKYSLALLYFQKSLAEHNEAMKMFPALSAGSSLSGRPLYCLGTNRLHELSYNIGLCYLALGMPEQAFDFFIEVIRVYNNNPKLWLRLAECCICTHKNGNDTDFDSMSPRRSEILRAIIGSGKHKKLMLNLDLKESNEYSYDAQSFAIPVSSLEFATLCLRNAMLMLTHEEVCYAPSSIYVNYQKDRLQAAICIASAYVSLCICDPLNTLYHTKTLNSVQEYPAIYKLLAQLYGAEAMIMMNNSNEAVEKLSSDFSNRSKTNVEEHFGGKSLRPYKPSNEAAAKAVILYNLAVTLALKGEVKRSEDMLKQIFMLRPILDGELPLRVLTLVLYLELMKDRDANTITDIIRQNCPQYSIRNGK